MEKTARAIVWQDNNIILIHRKKKVEGKIIEYYCTPGGHLEDGETFEEAVRREVKEELGVDVRINSLFLEFENTDINTLEKYYNVKYISGEIGTGKGEEFTSRNFEEYGSYEIAYVPKEKIKNINLLPKELKEKLIIEK